MAGWVVGDEIRVTALQSWGTESENSVPQANLALASQRKDKGNLWRCRESNPGPERLESRLLRA